MARLGYSRLTHYGVDVLVQSLDSSVEDDLKKARIDYVLLPIVEHKIYKYTTQGQTRYALVTYPNIPEEYREDVYITSQIPDDMDWNKLVEDCKNQGMGEEPAQLPTHARVMYDKAVENVENMHSQKEEKQNLLDWLSWKPKTKDINYALLSLESSISELIREDHHDVPELDGLDLKHANAELPGNA